MKKFLFLVMSLLILMSGACARREKALSILVAQTAEAQTAALPKPTQQAAPQQPPANDAPIQADTPGAIANNTVKPRGIATNASAPRTAATDAAAPGADTPGTVLFRDDFQDGNTDGWKISGGWDVNQNGDVYRFGTAVKGGAWILTGSAWGDYFYRAAGVVDSGSLAFFFRWSKSGRYILQYQAEGLYLIKESPKGNFVSLLRADPPTLKQAHNFIMGAQAGHIQVYVDRTLLMDYTDANPLLHGTIGVGAGDASSVSVDDVLVARLDKNLPAVSSPPPAVAVSELPPQIVAPSLDAAPNPVLGEAESEEQASPPPEISFTVNGGSTTTINIGECATVAWNVLNARDVSYHEQVVQAAGTSQECPEQTETLVLDVAGLDGSTARRSVTISVNQAGGGNPSSGSGNPDLIITRHTFPATKVNSGEPIHFEIGISNRGNAAARPFTLAWYPFGSGIVGCASDVNQLGPGQGLSFDCNYAGYPQGGVFNWRIIADIENENNESNEANNTLNGQAVVEQAGQPSGGNGENPPSGQLPNLKITQNFLDVFTPVGQRVLVGVGVYNDGRAVAAPFTLIWKPDASRDVIGCSWDFDSLGPGGGLSKSCEYVGYPSRGNFTWEAIVDPENEIAESNENDNRVTGPMQVGE